MGNVYIYTLADAERYAALRAQYLHWYERMNDEYHAQMADYCGLRIADCGS